MKKICVAITSVFLSFTLSAQNSVQPDQQQINHMKLAGNLPPNFQVTNSNKTVTKIFPKIYPPQNGVMSNNTCNCLIPIDSTFTIVPFDGSGGSGGPGTPPEYRNDDWSCLQLSLPFNFCYYGQSIDSFFINNNGNISFGLPYSTFTSNSFPDPTFVMIAPFWADVDTRGTLSGLVYYKVTSSSLIVIWDHVGYFSQQDNMLNTFQLIITDGNDPILPYGNASFCYGDMQWTTGSASGGVGGFGGTPATAGANLGDGINYIQFGQFDQPGLNYDGPFNLSDGVDWLDSSHFIFDLCPANVPPVSIDCMSDTVFMHVNDTRILDYYFLAPEINQNTTLTLQNSALNNLTVLSNDSGNYAHLRLQLIADPTNIGYNTFSVMATDNGSPAASTTLSRVVQVLPPTGISQPEQASVSFAPNPMHDHSILTLNNYPFQEANITLTDVTGRIVLNRHFDSSSFELTNKDVLKGFYVYHIFSKNGLNLTGKILVY